MSSRLDAHCSCSNFHKPEKVGAFAARPYRQDYSTLSPSKTQSIWLGPPGSAIQAGGRRGHHRCTRDDPTFRHSGMLLFASRLVATTSDQSSSKIDLHRGNGRSRSGKQRQRLTARCGRNWPIDPQAEFSTAPAPSRTSLFASQHRRLTAFLASQSGHLPPGEVGGGGRLG
jgi:hypothetical protein